jgi:tetratricopeptide (TPR) repeat protein
MPIDLTTLLLLGGLFFTAVIGDAAFFGDPLQVQVTLPAKLVEQGVTQEGAEDVFASEVGRLGRLASIVRTPTIQVTSRKSVLSALAQPFNLGDVVIAVQHQVGRDVVDIHAMATLNEDGKGLTMIVLVDPPHEPSINFSLEQPDGNVLALLRLTARETMERVAPYRAALADMVDAYQGDATGTTRARMVATRALAAPWVEQRATERVMLYNVLALVALSDGKIPDALQSLANADRIHGADDAAHGILGLNRAFIALSQRQPARARADYVQALARINAGDLPGLRALLFVTAGLVAWSEGDTAQAEQLLRRAAAADPQSSLPYLYLSRLLTAQGRAAEAAAAEAVADAKPPFDHRVPALAVTEYLVDPVRGGFEKRAD